MNINITRKQVLLAICLLTIGLASFYGGWQLSSGAYVGLETSPWITPPFSEASYVIGRDNSTHYYAQNHTGYGTSANKGYEFLSSNASGVWASVRTHLTTARAWKEKVVFIGNFTKAFSKPLLLDNYTEIEVQGFLQLADGADCNLFQGSSTYMTHSVDIHGGTLDGNKANNAAGSGIYMSCSGSQPSWRSMWHDLTIQNFKNNGVYLYGGFRVEASNIYTYYNDDEGWVQGSYDCKLVNIISGASGDQGFLISSTNNHLTNCKAYGSGRITLANGQGYYITGSRNGLANCIAQENNKHGFSTGTVYDITFEGCHADRNGIGTNNTYYGWYCAGTQNVVISGCATYNFQNPTQAIGIYITATCKNVTITGHSYRNNLQRPLLIENGASDIRIDEMDRQNVFVFTLYDRIYASNRSGVQYAGTDFATVMNAAWLLLTPARALQERAIVVGTYTISAQITPPNYVIWDISVARLKAANNLDVHPIYCNGKVYVDIVGGFVDGNSANQGAASRTSAIVFHDCSYCRVESLVLLDGGHSSGEVDVHEGEGIKFDGCYKCEVDACTIKEADYDGIKFLSTIYCTAENNYVNSTSSASGCIQVGGSTAYGNVIHGNFITSTDEGVKVHFATNTTISSNVFYADYAIDLIDNTATTFIVGNTINFRVRGFQSRNASGVATTWYSNNTLIEGNWFYSQYKTGYTPSAFYMLNSYNTRIQNNMIKGYKGTGEYFLHILHSAGSVKNLFVGGNTIIDVTTLLEDNGAVNFYWQVGNVINWQPCEVWGNATITSSTSVVVTPGIPAGCHLTNVLIMASSIGMGAYAVTKTATTFTITVSNTGTWRFFYQVYSQP